MRGGSFWQEGITVEEIITLLNFKYKNTHLFSIHGNNTLFPYQILPSLESLLTFNPAGT